MDQKSPEHAVALTRQKEASPHAPVPAVSSSAQLQKDNTAVHKSVENHQSEFCEDLFGHSSTSRMDIVIGREGIKKISCDICNKSFGHKNVLTRHIATAHQGNKDFSYDLRDK